MRLGPPEASSGSDNTRGVIVPAAALSAVISAAGEVAARDLGHALGRQLGERLRQRLDVREASPEQVTAELATELAIVGLGTLSFERWGRALVGVIAGAPFEGKTSDALLAAALESALSVATHREVRALPIARNEGRVRILLGNVASIERVVGWLAEGVSWGDAITRLHGGAS
ncbi:MAG: hypothetical protein ACXVEF_24455 [Polyangiales bacterium]